jgi:NADH-quinone oxidoreductase subunit B
MLIDAILKVHEIAKATKMGANREKEITALEEAAMVAEPTSTMKGLLR